MSQEIKILVVEDDGPVRNLIATALQTNQYKYDLSVNGTTAMLALSTHHYDVILLDLGLPDTDGIEIIKQFRTFSMTPIIVVSARASAEDKIQALDAGGDDYLTKPFSVEELLARVRSTIRRTQYLETQKGMQEDIVFVNGDLKIDYPSRTVYFQNKEIHLMPIEYELLCLLCRNVGKVLTHQYILDKVWTNAIESDLSSLRVYMTTLRKKIEKKSEKKYIQTYIGVGYKMIKMNDDKENRE